MLGVSVIVPVYNAEKYFKRGIDSILAQTYTDFELILVDDGSQDKSGRMCDDYAMSNPQVHVFHQSNKGVSAARQVGLDAATGEYVIFADPDDWIDSTMLDDLYQKAKQDGADVVICDFWINRENEEFYYCQQRPADMDSSVILRQFLLGQLHGSTCNKLYRLQLIKEHSVSFPQGINYCEDLWFNSIVFHDCAPRVSYLDNAYYHYDLYSNGNSMSRKFNRRKLDDYRQFVGFAIANLVSPEDEDVAFFLKYCYKRHAFRSNCNSQEYKMIYPELNQQFITKLKSSGHPWIYKDCEILALKGHLRMGRWSLWSYESLLVPILALFQGLKKKVCGE
jgi:glycosyltransferase involved in cell wall biosynthesis